MNNKKKMGTIILVIIITVIALCGAEYIALTYCMQNIQLLGIMLLVIPMIIVAIAAFFIGWQIQWKWGKGIVIAFMLTGISFIISSQMAGQLEEGISNNLMEQEMMMGEDRNEELMDELYDELDKKAYDYMLEQGLIEEGDEIFSESVEGNNTTDENALVAENDSSTTKGLQSELYIGVQKADATTELFGNIVMFLLTFGFSFLGWKGKGITNR